MAQPTLDWPGPAAAAPVEVAWTSKYEACNAYLEVQGSHKCAITVVIKHL